MALRSPRKDVWFRANPQVSYILTIIYRLVVSHYKMNSTLAGFIYATVRSEFIEPLVFLTMLLYSFVIQSIVDQSSTWITALINTLTLTALQMFTAEILIELLNNLRNKISIWERFNYEPPNLNTRSNFKRSTLRFWCSVLEIWNPPDSEITSICETCGDAIQTYNGKCLPCRMRVPSLSEFFLCSTIIAAFTSLYYSNAHLLMFTITLSLIPRVMNVLLKPFRRMHKCANRACIMWSISDGEDDKSELLCHLCSRGMKIDSNGALKQFKHAGALCALFWILSVIFSRPLGLMAKSTGVMRAERRKVVRTENEGLETGETGKNSGFLYHPTEGTGRRICNGEVFQVLAIYPFGLHLHRGFGVKESGSYITSEHVGSASSTLITPEGVLEVALVDAARDLIAFGKNPPKFADVLPGERVQKLHIKRKWLGVSFDFEDTEWHETIVESSCEGVVRLEIPKTRPGDSGLPIYTVGGMMKYVGPAGYFVDAGENNQLEQVGQNLSPHGQEMTSDWGNYVIIGDHPGSGKTRKHIKKLLIENRNHRLKYVAGPTRTVAEEIYDALKEDAQAFGGVTLETKGAQVQKRNANAETKVLSHGHLWSICKHHPHRLNGAIIIIDEFHAKQADTIAMNKWFISRPRRPPKVWGLSATTQYTLHSQSNHEIERFTINDGDVDSIIRKHEGQKILYIVPGGVAKYASKYKGAIMLDRDHFDNYQTAKRAEKGLIVATNIVEMGANLGVDVCIDSGLDNVAVYNPVPGRNPDVYFEERSCTQASAVQRAGRVGRHKPGFYYQVGRRENDRRFTHENDALWLDVAYELQPFPEAFNTSFYLGEEPDEMKLWAERYSDPVIRGKVTASLNSSSNIPPVVAYEMAEHQTHQFTQDQYYTLASQVGDVLPNCDKCPRYSVTRQDCRVHYKRQMSNSDETASAGLWQNFTGRSGRHAIDWESMEAWMEENEYLTYFIAAITTFTFSYIIISSLVHHLTGETRPTLVKLSRLVAITLIAYFTSCISGDITTTGAVLITLVVSTLCIDVVGDARTSKHSMLEHSTALFLMGIASFSFTGDDTIGAYHSALDLAQTVWKIKGRYDTLQGQLIGDIIYTMVPVALMAARMWGEKTKLDAATTSLAKSDKRDISAGYFSLNRCDLSLGVLVVFQCLNTEKAIIIHRIAGVIIGLVIGTVIGKARKNEGRALALQVLMDNKASVPQIDWTRVRTDEGSAVVASTGLVLMISCLNGAWPLTSILAYIVLCIGWAIGSAMLQHVLAYTLLYSLFRVQIIVAFLCMLTIVLEYQEETGKNKRDGMHSALPVVESEKVKIDREPYSDSEDEYDGSVQRIHIVPTHSEPPHEDTPLHSDAEIYDESLDQCFIDFAPNLTPHSNDEQTQLAEPKPYNPEGKRIPNLLDIHIDESEISEEYFPSHMRKLFNPEELQKFSEQQPKELLHSQIKPPFYRRKRKKVINLSRTTGVHVPKAKAQGKAKRRELRRRAKSSDDESETDYERKKPNIKRKESCMNYPHTSDPPGLLNSMGYFW